MAITMMIRKSAEFLGLNGLLGLFGRMDGRKHSGRSTLKTRKFAIEPLEQRQLLSVTPSISQHSQPSPEWFQEVASLVGSSRASLTCEIGENGASSQGSQQDANSRDWIVQFNPSVLVGINSAAETVSLLAGGDIDCERLSGN